MEDKNKIRDYEKELFLNELESLVPGKIFDSHIHIYKRSNFNNNLPETIPDEDIGIARYRDYIKEILPNREIDGLFFGWPLTGTMSGDNIFSVNEDISNSFVSMEVNNYPNCRGLMLVTPDMDPEYIRQEIKKLKLIGLKCYYTHSGLKNYFSSDINNFLPEKQVKIADEEGLFITLHIPENKTLSDPGTQEIIIKYCKKYTNMKLILAHSGMGFNPYHLFKGISAIKKLSNVWFDSSAVSEAGSFEIIIREMGHKRLLYGSDFPVSHLRTRCVPLGDGIVWLYEKDILEDFKESFFYSNPRSLMSGLECLRALKLAFFNLKLNDSQIEDIFSNNARGLFNIQT